jgi:hypothetical protein
MPQTAISGPGLPCTSTKKAAPERDFRAAGEFLVSVKGLAKWAATDCKTVYPGSIPGVASSPFHLLSVRAARRLCRDLPTSNSATYRAGRIVRPPMRALTRVVALESRFILDLERPNAPSVVPCSKTIAAMR